MQRRLVDNVHLATTSEQPYSTMSENNQNLKMVSVEGNLSILDKESWILLGEFIWPPREHESQTEGKCRGTGVLSKLQRIQKALCDWHRGGLKSHPLVLVVIPVQGQIHDTICISHLILECSSQPGSV